MTFWFDKHVKNLICYPLRKENEMSSPHFKEMKARDMGEGSNRDFDHLFGLPLQQEGRGGEVKSRIGRQAGKVEKVIHSTGLPPLQYASSEGASSWMTGRVGDNFKGTVPVAAAAVHAHLKIRTCRE